MSESTIRFHDNSTLTFGKPQMFDELYTKLSKKNYKAGLLGYINIINISPFRTLGAKRKRNGLKIVAVSLR